MTRTDPRKLAAGNWKMNGTRAALAEARAVAEAVPPGIDALLCPPATLIAPMAEIGGALKVGGQYAHPNASGAHTGDLSAEMLAEAGAAYVICGHSERRTDHDETSADVALQLEAAWRAGLVAILCIGETEEERDRGDTLVVLGEQLTQSMPSGATAANCVVAYEPVWAIGTGRSATPEQVAEVHDALRTRLIDALPDGAAMTLLYGGSVKAANAAALFALANVDGALVGGASLKAADFVPIMDALAAS